MSIEAMYPSRRQARSHNPLFERKLRRQRFCLMLVLAALGLGLLAIQFIPLQAHANAVEGETTIAAPVVVQAVPAPVKHVRQIRIYEAPTPAK